MHEEKKSLKVGRGDFEVSSTLRKIPSIGIGPGVNLAVSSAAFVLPPPCSLLPL